MVGFGYKFCYKLYLSTYEIGYDIHYWYCYFGDYIDVVLIYYRTIRSWYYSSNHLDPYHDGFLLFAPDRIRSSATGSTETIITLAKADDI